MPASTKYFMIWFHFCVNNVFIYWFENLEVLDMHSHLIFYVREDEGRVTLQWGNL